MCDSYRVLLNLLVVVGIVRCGVGGMLMHVDIAVLSLVLSFTPLFAGRPWQVPRLQVVAKAPVDGLTGADQAPSAPVLSRPR